jgi:hypothetical protein
MPMASRINYFKKSNIQFFDEICNNLFPLQLQPTLQNLYTSYKRFKYGHRLARALIPNTFDAP